MAVSARQQRCSSGPAARWYLSSAMVDIGENRAVSSIRFWEVPKFYSEPETGKSAPWRPLGFNGYA